MSQSLGLKCQLLVGMTDILPLLWRSQSGEANGQKSNNHTTKYTCQFIQKTRVGCSLCSVTTLDRGEIVPKHMKLTF
jgi:hypothetical protein